MQVAAADDVVHQIGKQRRPLKSEDLCHVEPTAVNRVVIRSEQIGRERDLLSEFRRGQPLGRLLHKAIDVLLVGSRGENRRERLCQAGGQLVEVCIGHGGQQAARLLQPRNQFRDDFPQQLRP